LKRQTETNADIILGVFPVDKPQKWDMVNICDDGRIKQILIKPIKNKGSRLEQSFFFTNF
jgi:glucose-1-phosphate thymidylyltransferase